MSKNRESLGVALMRLRGRSGLTLTDLAVRMGYKGPSSIQRYFEESYGETGLLPVKLASNLAKAMAGLGEPPISAAEIMALAGIEITDRGALMPGAIAAMFDEATVKPTTPALPLLGVTTGPGRPNDFPIYGTALGADLEIMSTEGAPVAIEQATLDTGEVIDYVRRPVALIGRPDAYAVIVSGESMFPRFSDGETVVVDPKRPASPGHDVIVQLRSGNGHDGEERVTCVLIKRLVRRSASWVELQQFHPPATFRIDMVQVKAIHRIMPIGELIGS